LKAEIIGKNKILLEPTEEVCGPKHLTLQKVTVLMPYQQKKLLDYCADRFMEERITNNHSERITSNTIMRCLIKLLNKYQNSICFSNIATEDELFYELERWFKAG